MSVRVRFAPSPTGHLHVGGARTALFNWLFARGESGEFILRIEDTDQTRSTEESIDVIEDSLAWLGLDWDEYYRQTERTDNYQESAKQLKQDGRVYEEEGALWFEIPDGESVVVDDIVLGKVEYETDELKDFVIRRSDDSFTYNFACVVDDSALDITHVMRGDDHLNNTPKQILVYEALGLEPPEFAHFPMILGEDHKRLSKRHGATSVLSYRDKGVLPEGLVNFLARLGWSHGDQEIFSVEELVEHFALEDVGESSAVFDEEKLLWMNHEWLKRKDPEELVEPFKRFLLAEEVVNEAELKGIEEVKLTKLADQLRERNRTLADMATASEFVFAEELNYDDSPIADHLTEETRGLAEGLGERLQEIDSEDFVTDRLEQVTRNFLDSRDAGLGDVAQLIRVALTGREVSPGLFITMELVGRERTTSRLIKVSQLETQG